MHYRLIHSALKHIQIKVKNGNNFQGHSLYKLGRFENAIKMYDMALLINPNNEVI